MAQRFYLPRTGSAPSVSPAFGAPSGNTWTTTTSADRLLMVTSKSGSTEGALQRTNGSTTSPGTRLLRQYVYEGLAGGPIGGHFMGVARFNEDNGANNACVACLVKLYDSTGTVLRGVLVDGLQHPNGAGGEFQTQAGAAANRYSILCSGSIGAPAPGTAVNPLIAQAGDVLVVELGYRYVSTTSTRWGEIRLRDNAGAGNDLVRVWEVQSGGSAFDPWVELSENVLSVRAIGSAQVMG